MMITAPNDPCTRAAVRVCVCVIECMCIGSCVCGFAGSAVGSCGCDWGRALQICLFFLLSRRSWSVAPRGCQSCLEGSLLFIDLVPACMTLSPVWAGGVVNLNPNPALLLALLLRSATAFLWYFIYFFVL